MRKELKDMSPPPFFSHSRLIWYDILSSSHILFSFSLRGRVFDSASQLKIPIPIRVVSEWCRRNEIWADTRPMFLGSCMYLVQIYPGLKKQLVNVRPSGILSKDNKKSGVYLTFFFLRKALRHVCCFFTTAACIICLNNRALAFMVVLFVESVREILELQHRSISVAWSVNIIWKFEKWIVPYISVFGEFLYCFIKKEERACIVLISLILEFLYCFNITNIILIILDFIM